MSLCVMMIIIFYISIFLPQHKKNNNWGHWVSVVGDTKSGIYIFVIFTAFYAYIWLFI